MSVVFRVLDSNGNLMCDNNKNPLTYETYEGARSVADIWERGNNRKYIIAEYAEFPNEMSITISLQQYSVLNMVSHREPMNYPERMIICHQLLKLGLIEASRFGGYTTTAAGVHMLSLWQKTTEAK